MCVCSSFYPLGAAWESLGGGEYALNDIDNLRATSHTRAKSHDHETVRAQKKVFKGRPNTPSEFRIILLRWT